MLRDDDLEMVMLEMMFVTGVLDIRAGGLWISFGPFCREVLPYDPNLFDKMDGGERKMLEEGK